MAYPFRNLVFEGGGVKGIAYVGALQVLDEKGILAQTRRVGGTSAGAINAALLGLGYSVSEVREILSKLDFRSFLDDSWGLVRDLSRLRDDYGWYKGDVFREWMGKLVEQKTGNANSTFRDIQAAAAGGAPFREMFFIGTNLSTHFSEVFSAEHTPRMCLADAVRISMSIPLFFAAKRSLRGDVYVDGGVLDNYPVKLFDREKYIDPAQPGNARRPEYYEAHNASLAAARLNVSPYVYNRETLGFRLDSEAEIAVFRDQAEPISHPIGDFFDYAWALIATILEGQSSQHLHSDDWQRTIYIDTLGVSTTDFSLSNAMKKRLEASGVEGTRRYFAWYDDPSESPVNRVGPPDGSGSRRSVGPAPPRGSPKRRRSGGAQTKGGRGGGRRPPRTRS
jgi:NTE family protein